MSDLDREFNAETDEVAVSWPDPLLFPRILSADAYPLLNFLGRTPSPTRYTYMENPQEPTVVDFPVEVVVYYWHDTRRPTTTFKYPPCFYSLPYAADYYEGLSDAFKRLCRKNRKN